MYLVWNPQESQFSVKNSQGTIIFSPSPSAAEFKADSFPGGLFLWRFFFSFNLTYFFFFMENRWPNSILDFFYPLIWVGSYTRVSPIAPEISWFLQDNWQFKSFPLALGSRFYSAFIKLKSQKLRSRMSPGACQCIPGTESHPGLLSSSLCSLVHLFAAQNLSSVKKHK